jgi:CubicO group peptidase (beta-lactamase class C family)
MMAYRITRRLRIVSLGATLTVLGTVAARAQQPTNVRTSLIDSLARAPVEAHQVAGLSVAVVQGRDTLLARAYGLADVENQVPATTGHVFEIASITKEFTAAAVLLLVQDGKVGLDDDITRFLPDAPTQGRRITIRQLLSHTSGLVDVPDLPGFQALKRRDLPTDSIIALARGEPFYFPPGEQMRYSNTGFLLAGQLIEQLSGRPYADFVTERLFRPAGMTDSRYCDQQALVPHLARGYDFTPTGFRPAEFINLRVPFSAGGLCSTALDLVAWSQALHGGRILEPAAYAQMIQPQTVADGHQTRYGLGLALGTMAGHRVYHHGGDIQGFTSYLAYFPDDSLTIAVLLNTQGPIRPDPLVARIAEAVFGPAQVASGPVPDLARFAGHYGTDVEVRVGDHGLTLTRGPMAAAELHYMGGSTFTDGRARYTFEPDGGRATRVWADLVWAFVRWERTESPRP